MGTENEVLTLDQLKTMIQKEVVDGVSPQIKAALDEFKAKTLEGEMKRIFPQMEGDFNQGGAGKTFAGSEFDMSGIGGMKNLATMSEHEVGMAFATQGGFFRKLSPAMELFAASLKAKGRPGHFDHAKLSELARKQYQALRLKAATDMGEATVGFDIPIEFPAIVIEAAVAASPILAKLWRFPMNENTVSFPKLSQSDNDYFGGVATTWSGVATSGEGSAMTPTSPTTTKNVFIAKKCTQMVVLTDELIQDAPINILNYITGLLVRKFTYEMERVVIKGNGTTEPLGIISDPSVIANAVARTTAGAVKWQDVVKCDGALNEIFTNAFLISRKATLAALRAQVDDNKRPIWYEGWSSAQGTLTRTSEICGLPYHVTRNCPTLGARGDVIVGDLSMYMLGMRADMRIDISDAPGFTKNETYVRFIARLDGMPGTSFAFKILDGALS